jgi:hypothetical protein
MSITHYALWWFKYMARLGFFGNSGILSVARLTEG